jgi:uncharacterized membrane protein
MSNLVVVGFDDPHQAEEVRLKLQKLQSEGLLDLADAVVAVKGETGKVKLHHAGNLVDDTAVFQGFCGSLASLIFLNAAAGAASGALTDVGINDHFMKEVAATLIPGSSALFVLTRSPSPDRDRMLEELKGLGGKILMTSLSHEDEARLQAALSRQNRLAHRKKSENHGLSQSVRSAGRSTQFFPQDVISTVETRGASAATSSLAGALP